MGIFKKIFNKNNLVANEIVDFDTDLLTPSKINKFVRENTPFFDFNIRHIYEYGYNQSFSEEEIEDMELRIFRINILVLTTFGVAHNQHHNIDGSLVNMIKTHRESLFIQTSFNILTQKESNTHLLNAIQKINNHHSDDPKVTIRLYWLKETSAFEEAVTTAIEENLNQNIEEFDLSSLAEILFRVNNPNEILIPYNVLSQLDENEVIHFGCVINDIYKKSLILFS